MFERSGEECLNLLRGQDELSHCNLLDPDFAPDPIFLGYHRVFINDFPMERGESQGENLPADSPRDLSFGKEPIPTK